MTNLKRLSQFGLSMLATGTLLVPAVTFAALATNPASQPAAMATKTNVVDTKSELGPMQKMLDKLNLTADQRAKIDGILKAAQPTFADLRATDRDNKDQLRALEGENYDEGKVKALADAQGAELSKRIQARAKLRNDIYQVLTPEQRQQVKTAIQQRQAQKAAKAAQ